MLGRVGSLLFLWRRAQLAWRLLRDRRVPLAPKLIVPAALFYAFFPVDLLPDFFPALGQLDDLTVLLLSVALFLRFCPRELVQEHLEAMAGRRPARPRNGEPPGEVIDGDYEILE